MVWKNNKKNHQRNKITSSYHLSIFKDLNQFSPIRDGFCSSIVSTNNDNERKSFSNFSLCEIDKDWKHVREKIKDFCHFCLRIAQRIKKTCPPSNNQSVIKKGTYSFSFSIEWVGTCKMTSCVAGAPSLMLGKLQVHFWALIPFVQKWFLQNLIIDYGFPTTMKIIVKVK